MPNFPRDPIVRLAEFAKEKNLSRQTLYLWEEKGVLPRRRRFGPGTRGWLRSELDRWVESRSA